MTTSISSALTLLVIGMITVFVVLMLVVFTGNILIRIVNRYFPGQPQNLSSTISSQKLAAITAAVEIVTEGKGKIISIEKENK